MFEATLSPGGLICQSPVAYIITVEDASNRVFYVGRTGSSNGTGTNSPYGRLAKHLSKQGTTQSCLWIERNKLRGDWMANAHVRFTAVNVPEGQANNAENWIISQFEVNELLNANPGRKAPEIDSVLQKSLEMLITRAIGSPVYQPLTQTQHAPG